MMKYLTIGATAVLTTIIAGPAFAAGETIAVFTKNQTNPYFQAVRVGTETAAKTLGVKVIQYIPTKPDSIPEQLSQVEDVIVKKPNAIIFIPVDYKALVPAVEKINAAGIPVTNITDRSAGGQFVAFVGADDYSIGLSVGHRLLKAIGGKGNVVILEGVKGSLTSTNRVRGFNDAIKEYPNVKLLASQPGNFQRLNALQVMENLMQSFPSIDGVLAANDPMAVGAIEALEGANRKAQVVGINGSKEAVELIKSGKLLASGDFNGFIQGCIGTQIAVRNLRKETTPKEVMLKPIVIDKSNSAPYEVPVEQRSLPDDRADRLELKATRVRGPALAAGPFFRNVRSDRFRDHFDGAAGAFSGAKTAALAIVVVEFETVAGTELDHRIVRADAVAVVALEAIAARQAAPRFIERVGLVEPALHLLERALPAGAFDHRPHRLRRIGVIPGIELVEARQFVLFRRRIDGAAQPGVDMTRRLLAVADRHRDGALRGDHVAAGEDAGMAGHHVGGDLHHAVLDLQSGHAVEQRQIDVLAEREHQRVGLQRLEFAGRLREALLVELHLLDGEHALVHRV